MRTLVIVASAAVLAESFPAVVEAQQATDLGACGRVLSLTCGAPTGDARLLLELGETERYWELAIPAGERAAVTARLGNTPSGRLVCIVPDVGRSIVLGSILQNSQLVVKDDVQALEHGRAVSTCDATVTPPVPTRQVKPSYTAQDMRAGANGAVLLHGVVSEQGRIVDVRVVRSVSASLDAEARRAFQQWSFRPAMQRGQPVAAAVTAEFQFRLTRSGLANGPLQPASGAGR